MCILDVENYILFNLSSLSWEEKENLNVKTMVESWSDLF